MGPLTAHKISHGHMILREMQSNVGKEDLRPASIINLSRLSRANSSLVECCLEDAGGDAGSAAGDDGL